MALLETDRLRIRQLTLDDAPFIVRLLNEPSFMQFIGDRGVRNIDDAREYLANGPIASYAKFGFGLYLVELKNSADPIGICGLLKRDVLDDVDIGYAFVPESWSHGYAIESARAMAAHARDSLGLRRIVAVTNAGNRKSISLLEKMGFRFERMVRLSEGDPEIRLYGASLDSQG